MLEHIQRLMLRLRRDEDGQTLVEYALIIALVSVGSILALGALSGSINNVFGEIQGVLDGALGGGGGS